MPPSQAISMSTFHLCSYATEDTDLWLWSVYSENILHIISLVFVVVMEAHLYADKKDMIRKTDKRIWQLESKCAGTDEAACITKVHMSAFVHSYVHVWRYNHILNVDILFKNQFAL